MKTTFVIAIMGIMGIAATSSVAQASHSNQQLALETADALVATLLDVADIADTMSARAARQGRHSDAKALSDLEHSAALLAQKLDRQVVQALLDGKSFAYVKAQISRLSSAFNLVDSDAAKIRSMPYQLDDALLEADYLKYDLSDILAAGDRDRPGRPDRDDSRVVIGL